MSSWTMNTPNITRLYYSITFDGHDAIWGDMFEGQMNDLLWEHNKLACSVEGNISLHELIKIAQGIVLE